MIGLAGVLAAACSFWDAVTAFAREGPERRADLSSLLRGRDGGKAGQLILVAAPFGENAATYFPANGDLYFTWLMASWGGDRLARVGRAPPSWCWPDWRRSGARLLGAGRSARALLPPAGLSPRLCFYCGRLSQASGTIFVAELRGGRLLFSARFAWRRRHGRRDFGSAWPRAFALGTKVVAVVFIPPLLAAGNRWDLGPVRNHSNPKSFGPW